MTVLFVPVVVVMPKDDYEHLVRMFIAPTEPTEWPADVRGVMARNGWTMEMVGLGRMLSQIAELSRGKASS